MKICKILFVLPMLFLFVNCTHAQPKNSSTGEVIVLTKADFLTKVYNYETNDSAWVYEGDKPCIIDFYADWCGPCKRIAPVLKELAAQYKDDVYIYKIDVDKESELAAVFGVTSIPMLLFVPMDDKPQVAMGALPKETIEEQIKAMAGKK